MPSPDCPAARGAGRPSPQDRTLMIQLSGTVVAQSLDVRLSAEVKELRRRGCTPTLAVLLVGNDPASQSYVQGKINTAERLGIQTRNIELAATSTQAEVEAQIL